MKKELLLFFAILLVGCANQTGGNIIGCWKSVSPNDKAAGISMSSTIVLVIKEDGNFQKTIDMWIGDENLPIVMKGHWERVGEKIVLTQTNTESGKPFKESHVITELTDEMLEFDNKFQYERVN